MTNILQFVDSINQVYTSLSATFGVSASNAWPALDTGQAWTLSGTNTQYSGTGSVGRIAVAAVNTNVYAYAPVGFTDAQVQMDGTLSVVPTGAPIYLRALGRLDDANNCYEASLAIAAGGGVTLVIQKRVTGSGTALVTSASLGTHSGGNIWRLVFRLTGGLLRAKAWRPASEADPGWVVSVVDASLTTGTSAGVGTRLETGNTNALAVNVDFDNVVISSPGQIRLDLNSGGLMVADTGIDLSPPPLRRSVVSSMLSDGDRIPATAWSNRTLKLPIQLVAATVDSAATQLQALARELVRDTNILRVRLGTVDCFFRTFAAPDFAFTMPKLLAQFGEADLSIPAEPFAYGLRETVSATINNDPAAGSNPQYVDVTVTKGDTDTPMILHLPGTNLASTRSYVAVRSRDLSGSFYALQAETATVLGTDATLLSHDAALSGSGSNAVHISYATSTSALVERAGFTLIAPGNHTSYRGRYRVLMRFRTNNATTHTAQILWGSNTTSTSVAGDLVTLNASSGTTAWQDLGVFTLPPGPDPVYDGYSGEQIEVSAVYMSLRSGRTSGTGTLDVDAFVFVPADQMAMVSWATVLGSAPAVYTLDGVWQAAYGQNAGPSTMAPHNGFGVAGVFPKLAPNATNRVFFVPDVASSSHQASDTLSWTFPVTMDYWPRYLEVRPVST